MRPPRGLAARASGRRMHRRRRRRRRAGTRACRRCRMPARAALRSQRLRFSSAASACPNTMESRCAERPEYALFLLRAGYELYANLRPVRVFPGLEDASSLRAGARARTRSDGRARADRRHLLRSAEGAAHRRRRRRGRRYDDLSRPGDRADRARSVSSWRARGANTLRRSTSRTFSRRRGCGGAS